MQITDLAEWVRGLDDPGVAPLVANLRHLFDSFVEIGLGYLSLDRPSGTLSGGEAQRTKMIRHLGSSLTDVTYVFDEPTVGLHPHDIQRMNDLLLELRDKGNTVLVVEHKPETIEIADHVVDLGPGAGTGGGRSASRAPSTGCGVRHPHRPAPRPPGGARSRSGRRRARSRSAARTRTTCRTSTSTSRSACSASSPASPARARARSSTARSPSGAGVVSIDQGAIHGSRRSNPATYTGLLDPIRTAFAKANGVKPALFSANSEGACPTCNGTGVIYTELGFMDDRRDDLRGLRGQALPGVGAGATARRPEHRRGARPSGRRGPRVLRDGEAKTPAAPAILERLADVGLGYLKLGQPLPTLSGGERQRLKLATHMGEKGGIYVLDEPTTGLHLADVEHLLGLLDRLVDAGKSVIVIEHHQAVMAHADWIIDLGPGAGHDGGRIVFEGTPADLVAAPLDAHRRAPGGIRRRLTGAARGYHWKDVCGTIWR